MRFRHKTGVRLASLAGPIVWVGKDWLELPPSLFQEMAMKAGCEVDTSTIPSLPPAPEPVTSPLMVSDNVRQVTRTALIKMISRNADGDFTKEGLPNLKTLLRESGTPVDKEVALSIFAELQREAEET
jgi:hypothetical protein